MSSAPLQAWNSRFRLASAARKLGTGPAPTVSEEAITQARLIDPSAYLRAAGYSVRAEGRHMSVRTPAGDEAYRITLCADGHFVACDHAQGGIGDTIQLVRHIEGCAFVEAVEKLTGGGLVQPIVMPPAAPTEPPQPPRLPKASHADENAGRAYLARRGIDPATISEAERQRFLLYAPGAVVFAGYADGDRVTVRSATRRAVDPDDEIQKRDFKGTDKSCPPILRGPGNLWIVEGGTDALALHSMARRLKRKPPTVVVSGGSNVLAWIEHAGVVRLVQRAPLVTIALEREKNDEVQEKTNAAHAKQAARLAAILGAPAVVSQLPAPGFKDLAEQHVGEVRADGRVS